MKFGPQEPLALSPRRHKVDIQTAGHHAMNQPSKPIARRPSSPFTLTAGALAVSLMLAACGGGDPVVPPDTTAPTVAITDNVTGTASGAVTFTFTFSEDVGTSFTAEDVTVAGGTVGAFAKVSATAYTLVVTPPASTAGSIAVSVVAAKFKDLALNDNTASASADQAYDTTMPPAPTGTVLASFDEATALAFAGFDGAESSSIAASPAGGTGLAAKIIRLGGQVWAGAKVNVGVIPLTTTNNTISARVYSPTAGVPMVLKLENATDAGINTGDIQATQTVVVGWQTLTWVVPAAKIGPSYSWVVMLPNLDTKASLDPGETYYFDDIKLLGTPTSGGGGGGSTPNPGAAQGSSGPVAIPVLTSPDTMGFAGTGDAVFAGDYIGALDANNKRAGWAGATTNGLANNGNIGYFQDTGLSTSAQKLEENGWVAGLTDNPGGVPSFFRYVILTAPASTFASSYLGVFANAPNNGTVNVSSYGNIKFRLWGPAEMYQNNNFDPQLEVTLAGAKVDGCTATGSGGTEIKKTFLANQKIGAASTYKLPLAAWTVVGVCGTDTNATAVASVLGALARVVVTVPGTSFNFTNANAGGTVVTYATGVNLGPIAFTNN